MGFLDRFPPRPAATRIAAWTAGIMFVRALLLTVYLVLGDLQQGHDGTIWRRLTDELTAMLAALPLVALAAWGIVRWPLTRDTWTRPVWAIAGIFVAFSVGHTLLMETARRAIYPLIGKSRPFDPGALSMAVLHEMPNDLFYFALLVAALALWRFWWEATERDHRAAELRRALADAQLSTLRLQLQPHFLFNALNTISATMYEDPRRADAILVELAELLRASLHANRGDEITLGEEVAIAQRYVRLQRARFGPRLAVHFDIPPACEAVRVPVFMLQPLIENAVRHGRIERHGTGRIHVDARSSSGTLRLDVWDDGDGVSAAPPGAGLGLRSIADRLALLHGDAASVTGAQEPDGWRVRVALPHREGP